MPHTAPPGNLWETPPALGATVGGQPQKSAATDRQGIPELVVQAPAIDSQVQGCQQRNNSTRIRTE